MKLLQGDCLELMREIPDGSVDMILTDPPYGATDAPWDVEPNYSRMFGEFWRVCKENAAVCIFSKLPVAVDVVGASRKQFRYEWIYHKSKPVGFLNANKMPLCAHENILVFYRKLPAYHPQFTQGKPYQRFRCVGSELYGAQKDHFTNRMDGTRYPIDVLSIKTSRGSHSCAKPIPLCEYLVKTYTNEGDTILDPFMGSGSTGVAALLNGRDFIGMELDEKYFEIAKQQIQEVETPVLETV